MPTVAEVFEAALGRDAPTWRDGETTARRWRASFNAYAAQLMGRASPSLSVGRFSMLNRKPTAASLQ